jgi:hypothetical protein
LSVFLLSCIHATCPVQCRTRLYTSCS